MSDNKGQLNIKTKRNPYERVFIVTEIYAGKKNLSDILADLLYSAYCKREPENKSEELNLYGYPPDMTGNKHYGDGAY